ncbi:MAG: hypothetical protein WCX69_03755 [Candidatus Paceibacterota bacterium]
MLVVRAIIDLALRYLTACFDQYPALKGVALIVLAILGVYIVYRFAKKMFFGIVTPILYILAVIAIVGLIGWIQYPTQAGQAWDMASGTFDQLTSYYQEAKELLGWAQQAKSGADSLNQSANELKESPVQTLWKWGTDWVGNNL